MPAKDQSTAYRKWYLKNRKRKYDEVKRRRLELRQWLDELKRGMKCSRCPETHIRCLDFHHVESNKIFDVSTMAGQGFGKDVILAEIAKCIVLCANCHRKETHENLNRKV